jgi:UDP-N-acetylglucosamine 4,6-dehydratase
VGSRVFRLLTERVGRIADAMPAWTFNVATQLVLDSSMAAAALICALAIRFEFDLSRVSVYVGWVPMIALIRPLVLWAMRGYRSTWRHFHLSDGLDLTAASAIVTSALILFRAFGAFGSPVKPLPYSIAVSETCLFVAFATALRVMRRLSYAAIHANGRLARRAILVSDDFSVAGAVRLIEPYQDVNLIGILSTDRKMHGRTIAGITVLGGPEALQEMIVTHGADIVLMTSSGVHQSDEISSKATALGVPLHIVPTARDLVADKVRVSRALAVEQVIEKFNRLNTEPHPMVVETLHQKCVLVTGAGGSIGSEISRQVAFLPVTKLVLLDQDENSIFELLRQLECACAEIVSCVGDIRDATLLERVFSAHKPDVVLHAAAYKHVPVMEANPCEAVLNNVTGTRLLIEAAERHRCERFVMISTDKAVHPSSVMGATKRAAELLVQQRAGHRGHLPRPQFACVRFGNVVGSRGSVVPIFLRQIAAGGPVTITDQEMTRYFMTIPQAVQLVLRAATLASTGDIYMLDMGDPVKIIEFARELIRMAGLRPDIDIPIRITGTRPGEKLHEQLWYEGAEVSETLFTSVFRVKAQSVPQNVAEEVAMLERAAASRVSDDEIIGLFCTLPLDYQGDKRSCVSTVSAAELTFSEKSGEKDLTPTA